MSGYSSGAYLNFLAPATTPRVQRPVRVNPTPIPIKTERLGPLLELGVKPLFPLISIPSISALFW